MDSVEWVTGISYVTVQVYEHYFNYLFTPTLTTMSVKKLLLPRFERLQAYQILWALPRRDVTSAANNYVSVLGTSRRLFDVLTAQLGALAVLIEQLKGRKRKETAMESAREGVDDGGI